MGGKTLYERLGGYDGIVAVADALFVRVRGCTRLGRFWAHRGDDGIAREKQLLIDYLCASAGGPMYYTGRDMKTAHHGMRISESDWETFVGHVQSAVRAVGVDEPELGEVLAFVTGSKDDVVES